MDAEWMTVSEAAEKLQIPNDSLRRYLRIHGDWLKIRKDGRSYRIHSECLDLLRKIREAYEDNRSSDDINEILSQTQPITVQVTDERTHERKLMSIDQALQAQTKALAVYERQMANLTEEVKQLRMDLKQRDQAMEDAQQQIEKTNRMLAELMQEKEEEKTKPRRGFLAAIFRKE